MWRMILLLGAWPAWAESVVATRSLPPGAQIRAEDVTLVDMDIPDAARDLQLVIGQIATAGLTAGRAVRADQIEPMIWVERNAVVAITLRSGGLEIQTEGRTLSAGGVGDVIDIMNLSSRARIKGQINSDGTILVTLGHVSE